MTDDHILIIGGGFAGIGLAIRLKKAGIHDFTILERASGLGGVWRDNRYPGAACDVQSHLYSFSFEPNPDWSREFAPQAEILEYLERCADKHRIREHVSFETEVTKAEFDEGSGTWLVQTTKGPKRARVLVFANGGLNKPSLPNIPGRDTFRGKVFHSSEWDTTYALSGQRVAVIGTGASAIQIVPNIASEVGELCVFQRSAPWIMPKRDAEIPAEKRRRFRWMPLARVLKRLGIYWGSELRVIPLAKRPKLVERFGEKAALGHLAATVADPALRRKLTPTYRMGCKRILLSNDYYPALTRPNVELVTDGVERITPDGIVTRDGKYREFDVIVYATGFHAGDAGAPFEIRGRTGRDLGEHWARGVEAYLGSTIPGFPNLFYVTGPNTGLSHSSMIFMMESGMNYILDAIERMRAKRLAAVEVSAQTCESYNREIQARLEGTVWSSGCVSWYLDPSGKNVAIWPGYTFEFRQRTRRFDIRNYHTTAKAALAARFARPPVSAPAPERAAARQGAAAGRGHIAVQ